MTLSKQLVLVILAFFVVASHGGTTRNIDRQDVGSQDEQYHATGKQRELQVFPPEENSFQSPTEIAGALRSPCPAINTLANHGFINRNGQDVTMTALADALSTVFDVTDTFLLNGPIASVIRNNLTELVAGAAAGSTAPEDHMFPISNLFNRNPGIIHDASLVRTDEWFCLAEEYDPNDHLIDSLLAGPSTSLTRNDISAFQRMRILDTRSSNGRPDIDDRVRGAIGGLSVQKALIMVIGQDPNLETIDKGTFEAIFRNETLPVGYAPGPIKYSFSGDLAETIRAEFTANITAAIDEAVTPLPVPQNSRCAPFPPPGNTFTGRTDIPGAVRSPCPAINTLANHGFINRNGQDVVMTDLAAALSTVFDVTPGFLLNGPIASVIRNNLTELVAGAAAGSTDPIDHMMPISNLFNRNPGIIHDASLVRTDEFFCAADEFLQNDDLIDVLLAGDSTSLTRDDISAFQRMRILDTRSSNGRPNIDDRVRGATGAFSVQKALIMVIGQDPALATIDKDTFEAFFRNETLPDDYRPGPFKYTFNGDLAQEIRAEFTTNIVAAIDEPVTPLPVAQDSRCAPFPPPGNTFTDPADVPLAVRSPCPAINTLANHGFINRNGQDVIMTDLAAALSTVFDVTPGFLLNGPIASVIRNNLTELVAGAAAGSTAPEDHMMPISNLFNRNPGIIHDASLVRTDEFFCAADEFLQNDDLIDNLLAGPSASLTRDDISAFQRLRILDTRSSNGRPNIDDRVRGATGAFSVQKALIMVIGQDPALASIDKDVFESFFRDETLPVGYAPGPFKYTFNGDLAQTIRAEFTTNIVAAIDEPVTPLPVAQDSRCGPFPPPGNTFTDPSDVPGAVRSPCPAINTLANHGFINRNGQNVIMTDLAAALSTVFDVTPGFLLNGPIASVIRNNLTELVAGAAADSIAPEDHMMPISNLFNRNPGIIHDASLVRTDEWFCAAEEFLPNDGLVDALLATGAPTSLSRADISAFQRLRLLDTRTFNGRPNIDDRVRGATGAFSVQKALIMVIGQDPNLDAIDKGTFEAIFRNETLPFGYTPGPIKYPFNGDLAQTIRAEFTTAITAAIDEPVVATPVPQDSRCGVTPTSPPTPAPGPYVEPVWFQFLRENFEGVNLRRCFKRDGITKPLGAPPNGSRCAKRPKTCFFGDQICPGGLPYPTVECICSDRTWECGPAPCPTVSDI